MDMQNCGTFHQNVLNYLSLCNLVLQESYSVKSLIKNNYWTHLTVDDL